MLYKDISQRKFNIDEFSIEIKEFILKTTDSIKLKAERALQDELKKSGWYSGPLMHLKSDILEILLEIK